jgi:hypothetical protein
MSDEQKYNISFGGTFNNAQFGVGDNVQLTMNTGAAAANLSADELTALRAALAKLGEDVAARAPQDRREAALEQVQQIADATVAADVVDVPRLKRITRWFAANAPELVEAVTGLLFGPAVGALAGRAGGLATALLAGDDDEPSV